MDNRELDAMVATHLFGWQWFSYPDRPMKYFRQKDTFHYGAIYESGKVAYTNELPRYSTDLVAAWQVIEKMRADGWHYELGDRHSDPSHCIKFGRGDYNPYDDYFEEEHSCCDASAPMAICLAALGVIGVEVG